MTPRASKNGIYIGLGANLASASGSPRATCEAALARLDALGARIIRRSRWFRSAPVPVSDQPWFVNGVAAVAWTGTPENLLALLHAVEAVLGRQRRERNEARAIDLDILAMGDLVREASPVLPHPRLHERAFVLRPLADLAPDWRHPVSGRSIADLIADLPTDQVAEPMDDDSPGGSAPCAPPPGHGMKNG
jgi:2-amino-4-hydroxy-6-hydroxymethyldihydropteridine diphosphokinase